MEDNKNKKLVIVIIVLCLLLVGMTSYVVYDKVINVPKKQSVLQQTEKDSDNDDISNKEDEERNLDVSLEEAKSAYYRIFNRGKEEKIVDDQSGSDSGFSLLHSFYNNKMVTVKENDFYAELMLFSFDKLPDNKYEVKNGNYNNNYVTTHKFLVSDIKSVYESYFGENNKWQNFNASYPLGTCKVEGEYYNCESEGSFGDTWDGTGFLTSFVKFETDKENLYVYDKALYYSGMDDDIVFYNSERLEKEIVALKGKNKNVILDDSFNDKMLWYKHTFKQNTDGTFYLYSTEPVQPN